MIKTIIQKPKTTEKTVSEKTQNKRHASCVCKPSRETKYQKMMSLLDLPTIKNICLVSTFHRDNTPQVTPMDLSSL